MADTQQHDAPPGDDDLPATEELSLEGDSMLDDLVALREERAAEKTHDMPLPGYDGKLWASYKLLGPKRVVAMIQAFADTSLTDSQVTHLAASFIADACTGIYMRRGDERVDFPGHSEDAPAGPLNLPQRLVPPRSAGREHTRESALRTLHARDNVLAGHALDVAGWMQSADASVAKDFSGE